MILSFIIDHPHCQIWHGHLRQQRGTVSGTVGGAGLGEPGTHAILSSRNTCNLVRSSHRSSPNRELVNMPALSAEAATEAFLFHATVALRLDDKDKAGYLNELLISPTPLPYNLLIVSVNRCIPLGSSVAGQRAQRG